MKNILSKGQLSILIVLGILILDQVIKIEVKTNMFYNESIHITDWFYLRFIENPGMAFGMQIVPKAIQTIARTIFAIAIGWYIVILIKAKYKRGYIACISLILAGAIGNIIDSIFYGVIFSKSTPAEISTFVPIGEGYTGWLHGKVVDMLVFLPPLLSAPLQASCLPQEGHGLTSLHVPLPQTSFAPLCVDFAMFPLLSRLLSVPCP